MPVTRERLIDKVYDNFQMSSQARSFFVYDLRADQARMSPTTLEGFALSGMYVQPANSAFEKLIHPDDISAYRKGMANIRRGEQPRYAGSLRVKDKTGEYVTCDFKVFIVRDYARQPAYLSVTINNRGRNALLDTVTNLDGRFEFYRVLREKKEFKKRSITVLLGTTNFATVNRLYGYSVGNRVLKVLSDEVVKRVGSKGDVFRAQGAAILVLTEELSVEDVRRLYADLRTFARTQVVIDGTRLGIELAGGAVEVDDFTVDEHTVYTCAKYALDRSTLGRGRNIVIIRNDQVGERNNTLAVINALRESIDQNCSGFYLAYQPMVSSVTGLLEGVEVLLRYEKAPYGKVPPALFLPALEKDEIFPKLGYWIIEQACREGKELIASSPEMRLHINLNYVQLEEPKFRRNLMDILGRTGFPGKNLCFELSENCKQLSPLFLKDEVFFLRSCGIKTALDGSCATSLDLIRELPVDMMKVDRSMVANIERNKADQYMMEAVTNFARKMNIQVCIMGVENEAIKNFLQQYPSTAYQGYLYSQAVCLKDLKELPLYKIASL